VAIQLGSAYGKVSLDSSSFVSGINNAKSSLQQLIFGAPSASRSIESIGASMKRVGATMTAAFTVPVLIAGKKAFDIFREFEQNLNILKSVSGATGEEMKKLSDKARELGADLTLPGTSAADAADAMAELAKAGLSVGEVLDAVRGVLQLSVAGQLSNAEAARVTANALNAFNLEGSEAVKVADLLAAAALASTAEVNEMADSLQMSAAVFAMSGLKIDELVTSIAMLSNAGIQGSDAGTSLKQMFLALETPSKNQREIMQQYGIEIYNAAGQMKSMRELIRLFTASLGGLNDMERNRALGVLFGSDAIRAANLVLMQGVDAYDQMYEAVHKTGAAAGLAASMMEGLTGSVENIKSAFETAAIAAIEPFKDDIKAILDFIAKAINAFSNLPEPVRKVIVVIVLLVAVIGPLLMIFGSLLPMLKMTTNSFNPLSGGIIGLIFSFVKLVAAAAIVVKVLTFLGISTGPVGAAVLGLNGAIAGTAGTIWAALVPAIGAIFTALLPVMAVIASLTLLAGIFAVAWKTNFLFIRDSFNTSVKFWTNIWKAFTAFLKGDTAGAMAYLKEAFQTLVDHINNVFQKLFGIQDAWGRFMEWMKTALGRVVSYISDVFTKTNWSQVGKYITLGIANGMLLGIPSLILVAAQAGAAALAAIKTKLLIKSPSGAFEKLGILSAQGYQLGLARAMSADAIANAMARPVNQLSNSQQQTINNYFPSGLTVQQVRAIVDERNEQLVNTMINSLGGA